MINNGIVIVENLETDLNLNKKKSFSFFDLKHMKFLEQKLEEDKIVLNYSSIYSCK